jgi:hypothetical protein
MSKIIVNKKTSIYGTNKIKLISNVYAPSLVVSYLVVGGGAGGYNTQIFAGGAGAVNYNTQSFSLGVSYSLNVGLGGGLEQNGFSSSFGSITSLGGYKATGGGNTRSGSSPLYIGGNYAGNAGGGYGGGGGGAGGVGQDAVSIDFYNGTAGDGGIGVVWPINGSTYGIGGQGGNDGSDTTGGGGGGTDVNGKVNTGGGGGGGTSTNGYGGGYSGGSGGSGIIALQIPSSKTASFTGSVTYSIVNTTGYKTYYITSTTGTCSVTFS